jgi:sugar lactone lactonase YvrE
VAFDGAATASAANWFAIVGNHGKTGSGSDSVISTTRSNGTSVISAPYTSIGRFAPTGAGAATAASPGYSDAGKTTLATLGKAAGALAGPIASDGRGNVVFFDPATNSLKQLDWTGSVRTVVASGLNGAAGLAVDRSGNVFIADRNTLPVVVGDASFESPAVRTSTGVPSFQYAPTGAAWAFTAQSGTNGSGLTGNGTALTVNNPVAPSGSQVAFLQGTGRISQSVTVEAGVYTLSLSAAQRRTSILNTQRIGVFVNGVSVGTLIPTSPAYATLTTGSFPLAKGTHVVEFRGINPNGGDNTAFIDSVAITSAQSPAIKRWDPLTGTLSTLLTTAVDPGGVAVDAAGNVFYSDGTVVKRWAAATGTVSTLFTGSAPRGLATDASGNLYAVDAGAGTVRKWTAATAVVSTITAFTGLQAAQGIMVDGPGDIYVADTGNNRIQKWDGATNAVTTLVSSGLSSPTGLTVDVQGNLFTINTGSSSSTLDAFQPWADVPSTLVGVLSAAGSSTLSAIIPSSQPLFGSFVPTSDQPWLRVTGTTDGTVRFAYDAAPSPQARTGRLSILGRQVIVSQAAGLSAASIVAAPTIVYGSSAAVTVQVTSTYATPTGTLELTVDGVTTIAGTLVAGSASTVNGVTTYAATVTIPVPGLTAGDHTLVANYASQATFAGSTALGSLRVERAAAVANVVSSAASSTYGDSVTFTARVPAVGNGITPSGAIQIRNGAVTIASGTLSGGVFTFTTNALLGGSHSLTAVYGGDSNHLGATSSVLVQSVARRTTVPSVATSAGTTNYGGTVTFTATLAPAVAGVPATGTVQFFDGTTPLGSAVTLSGGTAVLTTARLTGGAHTIRAVYSGDGVSYESATSANLAQTVKKVTSTPVVSDVPNPSTYGQTVTFTASLPAIGGGVRPTGTVQFYAGTALLGTAQALSAGTASVTFGALAVGTHSITARYLGDDPNYLAVTSATVSQRVDKAAATAAVSGTPNPTTFGQSVTFTATIAPAGAGVMPTGTIQFLDNGVALGSPVTLVAGVARLTTAALTTGSHAITARYNGDTSYVVTTSAAFSQTVNKIASSTTLSTSAGTTVHGQSVTFTATVPVAGAGGTVSGSVTFYDVTGGGRVALGGAVAIVSNVATFTTTTLAAGTRSIVAEYGGNANYSTSTSNTVVRTVSQATSTPTLTNVPATSTYGATVTITATVPRVTGGAFPTGSVTFKDNGVALATVPLNGSGQAVLAIATLTAGTHTLTTDYSGDTNYVARTSINYTQTVTKVAGARTVALSRTSSTYGDAVTITATVAKVGAGVIPTGTVNFRDGTIVIGIGTLDSTGRATLTTSTLVAGSRSLSVAYAGDGNYTASTSTAAALAVAKAVLAPTLSSTTAGGMVTFTIRMTPGSGLSMPRGTITLRDLSSSATSFATGVAIDSQGVATFSIAATTFAAVGSHPIVASYVPAVANLTLGIAAEPNYAAATSAQWQLGTVAAAGTAASTVTLGSSATTAAFGATVTFTATISVAAGAPAPTGGVVEFWDGDTYLGKGTITTSGGVSRATFSTALLSRGGHSIRARFVGNSVYAASSSGLLSQTIV